MKHFSINLTEDHLMTRCIQCNNDCFYEVNSKEVDKYFEKLDYKKPKECELF